MLDTLKGSTLYVAGGIVLAIIGAVTFLANEGVISGTDVLTVITTILVGVVGLTTAHVVGQNTIAAGVSTVPAPPVTVAPRPSSQEAQAFQPTQAVNTNPAASEKVI